MKPSTLPRPRVRALLLYVIVALAGCQTPRGSAAPPAASVSRTEAEVNRITWGVDPASYEAARRVGLQAWLRAQLHPGPEALPAEAQQQIDAMTISRVPVEQLAENLVRERKAFDALPSDDAKRDARRRYQQQLAQLGDEAGERFVLRALYSPNQLQEQMTWFWMNHFNVFAGKDGLRALVGDYEENAIRPHALGKFRDLLAATVHHAAMLRYLDNAQNAAGHPNENYARELMELHTLGVNGGYSQQDVQELARILSGLGVRLAPGMPRLRPALRAQYQRRGLVEFNPARHDFGDKHFLGHEVRGRGIAEVDQAIDLLSRSPATARFVSRKLAVYFVGHDPPAALVSRMASRFGETDGDIAEVLATLFESPEFAQSLGHKFKDPVHYVLSAVRLAYDGKTIRNPAPVLRWLRRMGEPLYGRQTPDGYPLVESAWASPGQMTTRFEIARMLGSGSAGLFRAPGEQADMRPAFPRLANALYYDVLRDRLRPATRQALDKARSPQEWNAFLLASPDMMYR